MLKCDEEQTQDGTSPACQEPPHEASKKSLRTEAEAQGELADRYDHLFSTQGAVGCGCLGYFLLCLCAVSSVSAVTFALWSSMGFGETAFQVLQDSYGYRLFPFGLSVMIVVLMYVLDLFVPHDAKDRRPLQTTTGKVLFSIACVFFGLSCLLLQKQYPYVPLVINIFICPLSVVAVRAVSLPRNVNVVASRSTEIVEKGNIEAKMQLLKSIIGIEADVAEFYTAAGWAFLVAFAAGLVAWLVWGVFMDQGLENMDNLSSAQKDEMYMLWVSPLAMSISNLVFSLFMLFRVIMQRTYAGTDEDKNKLIASGLKMNEDMLSHRMTLMRARVSAVIEEELADEAYLEAARERYLQQHARSMKALTLLVKIAICAFMLLLGLLYVAVQLLYADSYIASMVLGILGAFFVTFIIFTYLSFRRIVTAMGKWVSELPAWKLLRSLRHNDWVRALGVWAFLPLTPLVLLMSVLNQCVRKVRGVYSGTTSVPPREASATGGDFGATASEGSADVGDPSSILLTPRVHTFVQDVRRWDWLAVIPKVYFICLAYFAYNTAPVLCNVGLSWMRDALRELPFSIILVMTFVIGVIAFLCPVVPGMTVYIFGGMVVSNNCPPVGTDEGFWAGSGVNIILCWVLKLAACAVQQKCIGELLGSKLWVRQQAGVHKVAVRCIESIMSKRGWTVGKVAILCGGPDWPVSVMAGVMGLSLFQCEFGTLPIIGFIAPCAMSGSLYLQVGKSDLWTRSASLMIVCALSVNMILWAVAAWAMQNELEQNYDKLNRKLLHNVDLHWLDYKEEEIKKKTIVEWSDVNIVVRSLYLLGAVCHILVCHSLLMCYSMLVSNFQVHNYIGDLEFLSDDLYFSGQASVDGKIYLFSLAAIFAFLLYFICWVPFFVFRSWRKAKIRVPKRAAEQELKAVEASWRENWLKEVAEADAKADEERKRERAKKEDSFLPKEDTPPTEGAAQTVPSANTAGSDALAATSAAPRGEPL